MNLGITWESFHQKKKKKIQMIEKPKTSQTKVFETISEKRLIKKKTKGKLKNKTRAIFPQSLITCFLLMIGCVTLFRPETFFVNFCDVKVFTCKVFIAHCLSPPMIKFLQRSYTPPKKYSSTWDSTCDISLFWVPIFIILCLL